jgi:hypothetical protein
MTCRKCGSSTRRRICLRCVRAERAAEAAGREDARTYRCPTCEDETSGEGVECYRCRSDDESEDCESPSPIKGTTSASGVRPRTGEVNSSDNNLSGSGGDGR